MKNESSRNSLAALDMTNACIFWDLWRSSCSINNCSVLLLLRFSHKLFHFCETAVLFWVACPWCGSPTGWRLGGVLEKHNLAGLCCPRALFITKTATYSSPVTIWKDLVYCVESSFLTAQPLKGLLYRPDSLPLWSVRLYILCSTITDYILRFPSHHRCLLLPWWIV